MQKVVVNVDTKTKQKIELTAKEKRERLTESAYLRLIKNNFFVKKLQSIKEKNTRKCHYTVIGELTVKFSNLEQTIKFLGRQFQPNDTSEEKQISYNFSSGDSLASTTDKYVKKSQLPVRLKNEISFALKQYKKIAKDRNKLLKSQYAYNKDNNNMSQVEMKAFQEMQKKPAQFKELRKQWIIEFNPQDAQKCIQSVEQLLNMINKIQHDIMTLNISLLQRIPKN